MGAIPIRDRMRSEIRLRGLTHNTERAYIRYAGQLADFHGKRPPGQLTRMDVKTFLVALVDHRQVSPATLIVAMAAVKLLFTAVLHRPWVVANLPRPKVPVRLPVLLAMEEVARLLDCLGALLMRTLAATIYATGLRITEARYLRPADIDSARNLIAVRRPKGVREREVPMGPELLERLRHYWRATRPQGPYLFPGQVKDQPITRESFARALAKAAQAAGIRKRVTPHVLRHSAGTHFLEMGCNQRTIQVILGHQRQETTERYTQVSEHHLGQLRTPLDELASREKERLATRAKEETPER